MTTLRGKIALGILLGLYVIFLVFVASLIIRNKRRARRRRKLAPAASGYKHLSSDVELGSLDQQQQDTEVGIAQLPTDREGGEDLESRPHLQIELENTEQSRGPYELAEPSENQSTNDSVPRHEPAQNRGEAVPQS